MKKIRVSKAILDSYSAPKLRRFTDYRVYSTKALQTSKSWQDLYAKCRGCLSRLVIGDLVYEFRKNTWVHVDPDCINQVNKYIMTRELKELLDPLNNA